MASPAPTPVEGALQSILHGILTNVAQKFNIAEVDAASGTMVDIEIDKIVLGSAIVGQLVLQNTSLDVASASAQLQSVQVILQLTFSFDWWINLGFWSDNGSDSLGTLSIPVDLSNIAVPSLNNIQLTIPSFATNQNISANIAPLTSVDLGGGSFTGLTATSASFIPGDRTSCCTPMCTASFRLAGSPRIVADGYVPDTGSSYPQSARPCVPR